MDLDPRKFPGHIAIDQRLLDQAFAIEDEVHRHVGFVIQQHVLAFADSLCFKSQLDSHMIDPKRLKSNVLRRIVADAQWDAGRHNQLALAAKASCDVEAARDHEFEAEGHRLVARVATQELLDRKESVR